MREGRYSRAMAHEIARVARFCIADKVIVVEFRCPSSVFWRVYRIDPAGKEYEI